MWSNNKQVNIGDRVTVKFSFEVESIRKNCHNDKVVNVGGWILDENGKCLELISVPSDFIVED